MLSYPSLKFLVLLLYDKIIKRQALTWLGTPHNDALKYTCSSVELKMFIKEEVQATCCTPARSGNCDKREYLALELTEHRPGSVLQEDAGQKVQQILEEIVFPAPAFIEYACYGQFLQVLMVIADCDFSICFSGQEFKINTIFFNLLVLVFRTEHPGTIRTTF